MCGVIGYFEAGKVGDKTELVKRGMSAMQHRGPDSSGMETLDLKLGRLYLGHTRLAILDLSESGHQPMATGNGNLVITYNGEIYNYREIRAELESIGYEFLSSTDSEVLLRAWEEWGEDSLNKLEGMFAFGVLDVSRMTLTLVRDGFGIKPLYYCHDEGKFIFASELSALRELDSSKRQLNWDVASRYLLAADHDLDEATFIEGVLQLEAGCFLVYDLEKRRVGKLQRWYWPDVAEDKEISFMDAADRLRELFLRSIELHLRSDVPVGAALSGGVDSSAIVCGARYLNPDLPIKTFSYVARGQPFNEEHWIDYVNGHARAVEHKFEISGGDLVRDIDDLISIQGEPFKAASIYVHYRTFREAAINGITVSLDGQGGDELLAGYHGYPVDVLSDVVERNGYRDGYSFLKGMNSWPGRKLPIFRMLLANGLDGLFPRMTGELVDYLRRSKSRRLVGWMQQGRVSGSDGELRFTRPIRSGEKGRYLAKRLRNSLVRGGIQNLLRTGDRCSMRWSVESRVPFLTPELTSFALSLPHHFLVSRSGETKHVFRHAMKGIVPDQVLFRRDKIGAATPEYSLLVELRKRSVAWKDAVSSCRLVDSDGFFLLFDSLLSDKRNFDQIGWRMFNLFQWIALNNIKT